MGSRAVVLDCHIDRVVMSEALERCCAAVDDRRFLQHMAINAAKLVAMHDDEELREIIEGCGLVTADGQSIVWASRLLGDPLPERVAGIDLMYLLLSEAERRNWSVYILGARPDVLQAAIATLGSLYPGLTLAGYRDGYFGDEQAVAVAEEIAKSEPDILFVGMPSPRKEHFLGRHSADISAPFAMGVGGSIDVLAGITHRAPRWIQMLGLEWLFRLLQEPRRLARRYAVTNVRFLWLLLRARLGRRGGPLSPPDAS